MLLTRSQLRASAASRSTQEETKTIPPISLVSKKIKKAKTPTISSRKTLHFQEQDEIVPPLPMSQKIVYTLPFLYPCDSATQAKLISRYLHGGEGQTSFFTFDDLISSKHVLYLNTESLSFSKLTVIKLIDLQTTLQDYYKTKLTEGSLESFHHASRRTATSQQNPRTSSFLDDMREFLSTYSEPAVESKEEEIELFEDAAGCMLDPDFERLIFRSERLVGMESIEVLSEVQTHHFKFSNVDLRMREDEGELDVEVEARELRENSYILIKKTQSMDDFDMKLFQYLYCQNVQASYDRKLRFYLPSETSVVKFEFFNSIRDSSYFYLIGSIKLTVSELLQLCKTLEESSSDYDCEEVLPKPSTKMVTRRMLSRPGEEDYFEPIQVKKIKKPKRLLKALDQLKQRRLASCQEVEEIISFRSLVPDTHTTFECSICGAGTDEPSKGIKTLALTHLDYCCPHKYCFDCIFDWAQKTCNQCPMCRKEFTSLKRPAHPLQAALKIHMVETVYIEKKRQQVHFHRPSFPERDWSSEIRLPEGELSVHQQTIDGFLEGARSTNSNPFLPVFLNFRSLDLPAEEGDASYLEDVLYVSESPLPSQSDESPIYNRERAYVRDGSLVRSHLASEEQQRLNSDIQMVFNPEVDMFSEANSSGNPLPVEDKLEATSFDQTMRDIDETDYTANKPPNTF